MLKDFWVIRFFSLSSRLVGALLLKPVVVLMVATVTLATETAAELVGPEVLMGGLVRPEAVDEPMV